MTNLLRLFLWAKVTCFFAGLTYNPTSVMFINVPSISKLQWHPFTVTSNNNLEADKLSVVVKSEGPWTNKLYQLLSTPSTIDRLSVSVEGPYGPASTNYLRFVSYKQNTTSNLMLNLRWVLWLSHNNKLLYFLHQAWHSCDGEWRKWHHTFYIHHSGANTSEHYIQMQNPESRPNLCLQELFFSVNARVDPPNKWHPFWYF